MLIEISQGWGIDHTINAHFSPDGSKIVFMGAPAGNHNSSSWDIYLWDLFSDLPINLTANNGLRDEDPKFSPNGNKIVFKQNGDLKVMDLINDTIIHTTNNGYSIEESMPYFTSDNQYIIYASGAGISSDIYIINKNGMENQPLENIVNIQEYYPIIRSNSTFLYTRWVSAENHHDQIYLGYFSDTNSQSLSFNDEFADDSDPFPVNSEYVLFSSNRSGGQGGWDLYLADINSWTTWSMDEFNLNSSIHELGICYYNDVSINGCTNPEASNYDPEAMIDDGSCCVELWGICYSIEETDSLNLSWNQLGGEIPSEIGNLINLTYLNLYITQLTGEIPSEIGNLTNLIYLNLNTNQLTGEIPAEIWNLTNLTFLSLLGNQLTGEIPSEIGNLTTLTVLKLFNNELTGIIPESICDLTLDLTSTDYFNLSNNYLCPPYPQCLNPQVVGYQNLEECEYTISCDDDYTESNGFCYYQSDLDVLQQFIDNSQEGEGNTNWPQVPSDLPPLELGLQVWEEGRLVEFCSSTWYAWCHSDYELRGEIPSEISNLTNLVSLGLHNNNLSGEIPSEIGNLTNLEHLSLSSNELSGEVPSEIGNLTNLTWLWLYANELSGEIPESICNITNLDWSSIWTTGLYSYLNVNQFCPPYPDCLVNQEEFTDENGNGIWDEGEPYVDANENSIYEEDYVAFQDTSSCYVEYIYGCTDPESCNYNPFATADNGSCEYPDCLGGCNDAVTLSNQWSDGLHYDFTYTLGELTDYQDESLQQIAQKEITRLTVTCQETGQIWSFDSNQIASGNGNHNFSYLQNIYKDFPLPIRNITNGVLIGIDTYSTGNYHSLWFSVTAIDDEGNEFTHDNYVDLNPYGWYSSNEITFPSLHFTGVVDYANLDVLYAEGAFQVADITYQIGGDGYSDGFVCDETCEGSLSGNDCENTVSIELHEGSNLMSFYVLPEDNSVVNVLSTLGDNVVGLSGEGEAALNTDIGWVGSLTTVLYENGYWLLVNDFSTMNLTGIPIQANQLYALHAGNNLISYPLSDCGSIDEVMPDEVEDCIFAIAGEGVAALHTGSGWVGSLTSLCPGEGYWFVNQCDGIEFTFDEPISIGRNVSLKESPNPYYQSSKQAFYFIESIDKILQGDWILAYNGKKVIGARQWQGEFTDIPVMGDDGSGYTAGYMKVDLIPQFKLLKDGMLINLEGDIPAWSNNEFFIVSNLSEAKLLSEKFSLSEAYPNPFNPTTTMTLTIPVSCHISVEVSNLLGQVVSTVASGYKEGGTYTLTWDASDISSGMYFIKAQAEGFSETRKLLLIK